jgi:hypothetical protein
MVHYRGANLMASPTVPARIGSAPKSCIPAILDPGLIQKRVQLRRRLFIPCVCTINTTVCCCVADPSCHHRTAGVSAGFRGAVPFSADQRRHRRSKCRFASHAYSSRSFSGLEAARSRYSAGSFSTFIIPSDQPRQADWPSSHSRHRSASSHDVTILATEKSLGSAGLCTSLGQQRGCGRVLEPERRRRHRLSARSPLPTAFRTPGPTPTAFRTPRCAWSVSGCGAAPAGCEGGRGVAAEALCSAEVASAVLLAPRGRGSASPASPDHAAPKAAGSIGAPPHPHATHALTHTDTPPGAGAHTGRGRSHERALTSCSMLAFDGGGPSPKKDEAGSVWEAKTRMRSAVSASGRRKRVPSSEPGAGSPRTCERWPVRAFPPSIFIDKNRTWCNIDKSQSKWTASKMKTPGARLSRAPCTTPPEPGGASAPPASTPTPSQPVLPSTSWVSSSSSGW